MQNALRKWLVGAGLMALLLAFAVPALAQNQWTPSSTTFPTPVQSMALSLSYGQLSVGTYGGGYPGGTNGGYFYDNSVTYGDIFTGPVASPAPANDDMTVALWDAAPDTLFFGTWNTGLYMWQGAWTHLTLPPWVNVHITSLAIDSTVAPGLGIPHMLYVGTWGGAVYSFDGATWTQIPNYFNPGTFPAAQFIHKVAVIPAACNAQPLTIYAATDGYGVVKGVKNCISGTWSWSQVGSLSGDDAYVYALALDASGNPYIGTRAGNVYYWGSGTWNPLSFSPAIGTPVKDLAFDGTRSLFVATWGQGVFRYNFAKAAGAQINAGYAGWNLTYLYDSVLVWDGVNSNLYVGTGNSGGPGAAGKVFYINLMGPSITSPFTKTNEACTTYHDNLGATSNQNPKNWTAAVTSGSLPPGYTVNVNNSPATPAVTIDGSATEDCYWNSTVSVWDSLLNQTDVTVNYTIQLQVSFTVDNYVVPLGTIQAFTSTVCGATGTISYDWDFGDGSPHSTLANPTHIYATGGTHTVTLWVSDSNCPGGAVACPATAPDNCTVDSVTVYDPLTVDPTATIVGSGSQFQFWANALGGDTTTCAGYTFNWVFTDQFTHAQVGTSTQENPVITFAYFGSFVGTVTVTDCAGHTATGSCTVNYNGSMAVTIAVDANPVPDDHTIMFLITAQGCGTAANFLLDFDPGDGSGVTPGIAPTFVVGNTASWMVPLGPPLVIGNHTATATVHDDVTPSCGHTTIITYDWRAYAHFDHITIAPSGWTCPPNPGGHVPQTVSFTVTPTGGLPNYLYSVDWGDGATTSYPNRPAGATTISHTYTTAGIYTITVYATDSGFYAVTLNSTYGPFTLGNVTVGHIGAAGANQAGCQQYSTTQPVTYTLFNDTVLSAGVLATDFTYDFDYGDGSAHAVGAFAGGTVVLPGHLYTIPVGYNTWTYTATLVVHNNITCENHTSTFQVTIYYPLLPPAAPTWLQSCGSRLVTFTAIAPTTGIGPYTYIWDFGDATPPVSTTTPTTTHTYALNGNYNCQLTVIDSVCAAGFHNTVNTPFIIRVVEPINVSIATTYTPTCAPSSALFTSTATGGGLVPPDPSVNYLNYLWTYTGPAGGSFTAPNSASTYFNFTASGDYYITLTVTSADVGTYSCSSNTVHIVAYGGLNTGSFSFTQTETSGYLPLNDTFTTTWTMGGSPASPVTLTYNWGDGTPNTVVNNATSPDYTQHTFEIHSGALGWLVTVTAVDACGNTASMSRRIVILQPPALTVTTSVAPTAGIVPLTAAFTSIPSGGVPPYTYAWTFGDGGTSTAQNPTHIYSTAGVYNATLTVTDSWPVADGGPKTASANVTVTVYNPLVVNATGTPTAGSTPLTVNFSAAATGGSANKTYFWYFGDGANASVQNPTHIYNTAGTYFAYVVVSDDASHTATSNQVVINVYDPLVVTANATPSQGTKPLAVTFTAQANGGDRNYTYSWTFGDSGTGSGALVNHTYTAAGTYNVNVHVVDGVGHSADKALTVTVWDPLTATITGTKAGTGDYVPMTYNFTSAVAGGNGTYTYSWNFGDGGTSSAANPSHTYTTAGSYAVTLVVSDTASHAVTSNTINITLYAPLAVSASATPSTLIVGNSVTFNAVATGGNGVYSYAWTFGDTGTGTGATVNHTYATKGTYTAFVVVTDGASHTVTSANITITVKPVPPSIITAVKMQDPFRIKLLGTNFQSGCTATINGNPVTVTFKDGGRIILKNCKSYCPKGVPVQIVVTNPDGGVSNAFQFVR